MIIKSKYRNGTCISRSVAVIARRGDSMSTEPILKEFYVRDAVAFERLF